MKKFLYLIVLLFTSVLLVSCGQSQVTYTDPATGEQQTTNLAATEDKMEVADVVYSLANEKVDTSVYSQVALNFEVNLNGKEKHEDGSLGAEQSAKAGVTLELYFNKDAKLETYKDLFDSFKAYAKVEVSGKYVSNQDETKSATIKDTYVEVFFENGTLYLKANLDNDSLTALLSLPEFAQYSAYKPLIDTYNGKSLKLDFVTLAKIDLNAQLDVEVADLIKTSFQAELNASLFEIAYQNEEDNEENSEEDSEDKQTFAEFALEGKKAIEEFVKQYAITIKDVSGSKITFNSNLELIGEEGLSGNVQLTLDAQKLEVLEVAGDFNYSNSELVANGDAKLSINYNKEVTVINSQDKAEAIDVSALLNGLVG